MLPGVLALGLPHITSEHGCTCLEHFCTRALEHQGHPASIAETVAKLPGLCSCSSHAR